MRAAWARSALLARSALMNSTPGRSGALSGLRARARTLTRAAESRLSSSVPMVPVAPVTRIMPRSLLLGGREAKELALGAVAEQEDGAVGGLDDVADAATGVDLFLVGDFLA